MKCLTLIILVCSGARAYVLFKMKSTVLTENREKQTGRRRNMDRQRQKETETEAKTYIQRATGE